MTEDSSEEVTIESTPHSSDCFAVDEVLNGVWDTPWTFVDLETHHTMENVLVEFQCNNPECDGTVVVKAEDVLQMLPLNIDSERIEEAFE